VTARQCTRNRFLGGRVVADQPETGFRAGHDTVLLASAVPALAGEKILELGSGTGIVSLCLAARVEHVEVLGIEIDAELIRIANANAVLNGLAGRVRFVAADIMEFAPTEPFDHVFFNPPFHPDTGQVSPDPNRDRAKRDVQDAVLSWTRAGLALSKPGGTLTAILRADRVEEMLAEASDHAAVVCPLLPHAGDAPKRCIVRIAKGRRHALVHTPGLVLHEADGRNTEAAEAILRHGGALAFA
jgi:tRNA1(Val) A37 N6-methylase TrmN6